MEYVKELHENELVKIKNNLTSKQKEIISNCLEESSLDFRSCVHCFFGRLFENARNEEAIKFKTECKLLVVDCLIFTEIETFWYSNPEMALEDMKFIIGD